MSVRLNEWWLVWRVTYEGLLGPWEDLPLAEAQPLWPDEPVQRAWVRRWLVAPLEWRWHLIDLADEHVRDDAPAPDPTGRIAVLLVLTPDGFSYLSGLECDGFWSLADEQEAKDRAPRAADVQAPCVDAPGDVSDEFLAKVRAEQDWLRGGERTP